MAYTVLARKYRSRTFTEVVGQGPIATTLVNAIQAGRIHHGYLFTGTRGVGKTSMARILAKALNCLQADAPTPTPCLTCESCTAIAEGQDLDVIEIDAASNTGVDDVRELRSNAAYHPARARFKIYIIDEVHMLSTGAFNALLKTLEEPPEHVKFILATTEIHKVPATIQSRCQRFNFRSIGPDAIAQRLAEIVTTEGANAEDAVLRRVARLANGSMRDALSILDQLLSVSPTELSPALLDEILPPAQDERTFALLRHAAAGDVPSVLAASDALLSEGRSPDLLCSDLVAQVHTLMLLRACGADTHLVDVPAASRAAYAELAGQFELSQYVQMVGLFEELRRQVRFSAASRALVDACLVRVAHMKAWAPIEQVLRDLADDGPTDEKKKITPPSNGVPARPARAEPPSPPPTPSTPRAAAPAPAAPVPAARPARPAAPAAPQAAPASTAAPTGAQPVSADEHKVICADPLVRQALELFDGIVVHIERRPHGAGR